MAFIQIIELTTTRRAEVEALVAEWRSKTEGRRKARRGTFTADLDRADTYIQIVEFDSAGDAKANSDLPETGELATRIAELCNGPVSFRNLDVLGVEEM